VLKSTDQKEVLLLLPSCQISRNGYCPQIPLKKDIKEENENLFEFSGQEVILIP